MNSHSASALASSSSEPPHRTVPRRPSSLRSLGLALCPAAAAAMAMPSLHEAFATPASRNFIHLASTSSQTTNFVVIRSFGKGSPSSGDSAQGTMPARGASERVEINAEALDSFVSTHKLALRPVFLHLSSLSNQKERQSVIGLRGNEVWRYDMGSHSSRRVSRLGIAIPLNDALRAEHESAVVDAKIVLSYQPTMDLPNGDATAVANAPVSSFVHNGRALYQVSRSKEGSFAITQIGVLEDSD